jgi:cellulose synthase operon protein YhjU
LDNHPFFRQFNFLFTNFNSVSSYTNPSAIRLLRANCGQQKHDDLYNHAPKECYLLESLREKGYETYSAIDNDAPEYNFVSDIVAHGLADPPMNLKGVSIQQYDFDGTPIYNDLELLQNWWNIRKQSKTERASLYFDLTTLHAGAHWAGEKSWWKKDPSDQYKEFVQTLFGNLEKFFKQIASSGKNFVIVFIPEHGMAVRGSSIQAPDLRDIPLPQITIVPVGIKLIGKGYPPIPARQEIISKPTSYLALSYMIVSFLKDFSFATDMFVLQNILSDIPETTFVSENQEAHIVKKGTDYFLYNKEKKWIWIASVFPVVLPRGQASEYNKHFSLH